MTTSESDISPTELDRLEAWLLVALANEDTISAIVDVRGDGAASLSRE